VWSDGFPARRKAAHPVRRFLLGGYWNTKYQIANLNPLVPLIPKAQRSTGNKNVNITAGFFQPEMLYPPHYQIDNWNNVYQIDRRERPQ
jgi:hypothetical protein